MSNPNSVTFSTEQSVSDALAVAIKLVGDKELVPNDHMGETLVLCGLLTVALILEGRNASETS